MTHMPIDHYAPPKLGPDVTRDRIRTAQRATSQAARERARNAVVTDNMALVARIADRYTRRIRRPDLLEDLIMAGVAGQDGATSGLIRAIEKVNLDVEPRRWTAYWTTYAGTWIQNAIQRATPALAQVVEQDDRDPARRSRILRAWDELSAELGREPSVAEVREAVAAKSHAKDARRARPSDMVIERVLQGRSARAVRADHTHARAVANPPPDDTNDRADELHAVAAAILDPVAWDIWCARWRPDYPEPWPAIAARLKLRPAGVRLIAEESLTLVRAEVCWSAATKLYPELVCLSAGLQPSATLAPHGRGPPKG